MMLGNLSIDQIEKRLGIMLDNDTKNRLKNTHQAKAEDVQTGKWHCFDMPFVMVCGNYEFAKEVYEIFKPHSDNMVMQFQIAIEGQF